MSCSIDFLSVLLFIIADKATARGEDVKRCRCCERQRAKAGGWRSLSLAMYVVGLGGMYLEGAKASLCETFFFVSEQTNGSKMAEGEEEVMEEPWVPSNEDISNALSGLAKTEDGASVVYTKLALPGKQVFDVRVSNPEQCALHDHTRTVHTVGYTILRLV